MKYEITEAANHDEIERVYNSLDDAVAAIRQAYAPFPVTVDTADDETITGIGDDDWTTTGVGSRELTMVVWLPSRECRPVAYIETVADDQD